MPLPRSLLCALITRSKPVFPSPSSCGPRPPSWEGVPGPAQASQSLNPGWPLSTRIVQLLTLMRKKLCLKFRILGAVKHAYINTLQKTYKQHVYCDARSHLQVGDYVFAKIVTPNGFDFYVPAIVIALPNQNVVEDKLYTVLKCNNRRVSRTAFRKGPSGQQQPPPRPSLWASPSSSWPC